MQFSTRDEVDGELCSTFKGGGAGRVLGQPPPPEFPRSGPSAGSGREAGAERGGGGRGAGWHDDRHAPVRAGPGRRGTLLARMRVSFIFDSFNTFSF